MEVQKTLKYLEGVFQEFISVFLYKGKRRRGLNYVCEVKTIFCAFTALCVYVY